jgi:hypothetical protein
MDFPVTSCARDILETLVGPFSLQVVRSVPAVPNQRQSAWEVTVIVQHSYGFCLLGEPPC